MAGPYHPPSREFDFATNKLHYSHNALISARMDGYARGPNALSGSMAKLPTFQHRYTVQNETVILVYISDNNNWIIRGSVIETTLAPG